MAKAFRIDAGLVADHNRRHEAALAEDYGAWADSWRGAASTSRRSPRKVGAFGVAIPTWGVGTGGTRFARFPGTRRAARRLRQARGLRRHPAAHARDARPCRRTSRGTRSTIRPSCAEAAAALGLGFDAVNSNTFQDQAQQSRILQVRLAQPHRRGRARPGGGAQHRVHRDRREAGLQGADGVDRRRLATSPASPTFRAPSTAISTAWRAIYAALPADWQVFLEHKLYEPAFYSTVIADWGSSLMAAQELGPKAKCLVDLGHHAPNANIEMIVARLIRAGKLAGFHFNDRQVRRRRSRRRLRRPVPPVPGLQRAGRRRAPQGARLRPGLHDRPVAQRHRPDREPDDERRASCSAPMRRRCSSTAPRSGAAGRQRRCSPPTAR